MSSKKLFYWLLVLVLISVSAAGCKAPESTAINFVPEHANLIASIQVSQIVNDQDLRKAYDKAKKGPGQPQTVDEALDKLIEETGIDYRDFSEAVVFAELTKWEQEEYLGIIAEGTIDKNQFIDNVKEKSGEEFTTSDYKGYQLYINEKTDIGIASLTDRMLLLGTTKAVKDAIDVSKGDRKQASVTILDTYNRLGDALIKLAFEFPQEAREALTEDITPAEVPISLEPLANIDIFGLALSKEADTLSIQINPHFLSKDSAEDARDALNGTISLFKGILQEPEIKELLGKIAVTVTDSWVSITFEITLSEIEKLIETFQPQ